MIELKARSRVEALIPSRMTAVGRASRSSIQSIWNARDKFVTKFKELLSRACHVVRVSLDKLPAIISFEEFPCQSLLPAPLVL